MTLRKDSEPRRSLPQDHIAMARLTVHRFVEHQRLGGPTEDFTPDDVYVVWFCFILGGWKALVSTTLADNLYYEVTYNKDTDQLYLDVYEKQRNVVLRFDHLWNEDAGIIEGDHIHKEVALPTTVCPECRDGKHGNCNGYGWDYELDEPTACPCSVAEHRYPPRRTA